MGRYEISLGDTIGVGTPAEARAMLRAVAAERPMSALAVHAHDTLGLALANLLACVEKGAAVIEATALDAAMSGAFGCPCAKGASGKVATEDVLPMLQGIGVQTGDDLELLADTGNWLASRLGQSSNSKTGKALAARE